MAAAAEASSSSHSRTDSNALFDSEPTPVSFPSHDPLSHTLPLLSPSLCPTFSPDAFLLSRGSDLPHILSELRTYSSILQAELYSIINEDYKDFVSLGSSLKSEAHRISRLGWNRTELGEGLMAPVRDTLMGAKGVLKSVQEDIESCIGRRDEVGVQRGRLELMLGLGDCVGRLEECVGVQVEGGRRGSAKRRPSTLSIGLGGRRDSVASIASEGSDYAMSSEYDEDSYTDLDSDDVSEKKVTRRKIFRRLSSAPTHAPPSTTRTRSDTVSTSSSLLGLPQRLSRSSAEYSRLRFLHRRLTEEGLSHYTEALADRIDAARDVLRRDLRALLSLLLGPESLLVHGRVTPAAKVSLGERGEKSELDRWSQVPEPTDGAAEGAYWEARIEEQRGWLEMVLSTLNTLTLEGSRNEAEEAVKDLLVAEWAEAHIVHSAPIAPSSLPPSLEPLFKEHQNYVQTLFLQPSGENQLVDLYNSVLHFTSTTAYHLIESSKDHFDLFTPLWTHLSTTLLASWGSRIFFVGQPDTFYTNFTVTNTFLQTFSSLAPTPEARAALAQSEGWGEFKRRWQLPVYFQMRFREVATALEAKLEGGREVGGEGVMRGTEAVLQAIDRVWSEGVHIHELSAREWRVTMQLLSRFRSWVEDVSPQELSAGPVSALRTGDGGERKPSSEISRVGTPQPPADAQTQQSEDEGLQLAVALLSDCLRLRSRMEVMLDETILPMIASPLESKSGLDDLRKDLREVLEEECLSFIPSLSSSVGRYAHTILTPRLAAPLRLLRSFTAPAYRPSPSPSPNTTPAVAVISQIFAPLTSFLSLPSQSGIPLEVKRGWAERILSDAMRRYISTLETINKNQQSLIRLKKSQTGSGGLLGLFKGGGGSAGGGEGEDKASETNKQALAEWEKRLRELEVGIVLEEFEGWVQLRRFLEADVDSL